MMELIKTEPWHLYSIDASLSAVDASFVAKVENLVEASKTGMAVTMMEDGLPLGVFGALPHWQGVGELWAVFTDQFRSKPFTLCKTSLRAIQYFREHGEFHRLQCIVLKDFTAGLRWIQTLGFTREGLLRMYGEDKQDYYRFARLF